MWYMECYTQLQNQRPRVTCTNTDKSEEYKQKNPFERHIHICNSVDKVQKHAKTMPIFNGYINWLQKYINRHGAITPKPRYWSPGEGGGWSTKGYMELELYLMCYF